ncbi:MAG: glycosyltransferase family 39 protein [Planctomycetota bacterium]|nr:glycosyltransferase family 39 protein [Planctomycetota bacterium]MDG1985912.1 glycosyltransferase family 39 protein [Planctomycetota bacterium]
MTPTPKTTTGKTADLEAAELGSSGGSRLVLLFVAVLLLYRIPLLLERGFDVDETQHLHGAYSISRGLTPHVDYFEHHSSWFAWLLSGPLELIGPSWEALMVSRGLMAACAAAGLMLTFALARRFGGGMIPAVAVALQATTLLFVEKSMEIRPDVPAAALWTLAVLLTVDGLRGGPRRSFAGAGVALGFGLLFTFKLAFGAIGLGLAVLYSQFQSGGLRGVRKGVPDLLMLVGWSALPVVLMLLSLAHQDQLAAFVNEVVIGPTGWPRELDPREYLGVLLLGNPLLVGVGLLGLMELLVVARAKDDRAPAAVVAVFATCSILAGWFTIPVPWPQFLMLLWPLLACAAATALASLGTASGRSVLARCSVVLAVIGVVSLLLPISRSELVEPLGVAAVAGLFGLAASRAGGGLGIAVALGGALGAHGAMQFLRPGEALGSVFVGVGVFCLLAAVARASGAQGRMAAVAVALCAFPLVEIARMAEERPIDEFQRQFDFVSAELGPEDTVLTGWTGCAAFQPHAYRYFFLHRGMLRSLDEEAKGGAVLRAIESNPPAAVVRDAGVAGLGPGVQAFIDAHYAPSGVGDIWLAR